MSELPEPLRKRPRKSPYERDLPVNVIWTWLRAGWRDFMAQPGQSLAYGFLVFAISLVIVAGLFLLRLDYILLPALAGFMVVGPFLAIGLYEKSRRLSEGERVRLIDMIRPRPEAGGQILFTGVLLCLLMLLWMRAAVILYALVFGLRPFPGLDQVMPMLLTTPTGWTLLGIGTVVGGLFAAFAFAISLFSLPMQLSERVDSLTAMGKSMALVWNNLGVAIAWGAIILILFLVSVMTALLGLIVVFPVLGHATWHAYKTVQQ